MSSTSTARPIRPWIALLLLVAVAVIGLVACSPFTAPDGSNEELQPPGPSFSLSPDQIGILNLGTLGGHISGASDVNDLGQVVGTSRTGSLEEHAFLWEKSTGMIDLGTLGSNTSYPVDINSQGQVAGNSKKSALGFARGFFWESGSGMTNLGTLGGNFSQARAMNDVGQIVGESRTASGADHAFLWAKSTGMIDLGTLGGAISEAKDINNEGQVVGVSQTAGGDLHAFLWESGTGMIDLGTLGGAFSEANAINDRGQVVGRSQNSPTDLVNAAFLWEDAAGMTEIADLGGTLTTAVDINENGQVTGYGNVSTSPGYASFLWESGPGVTEIGPGFASDINENGQIVGSTGRGARSSRGFFWDEGSGRTILSTLDGGSAASAINERSQIAGYSTPPDDPDTPLIDRRAVLWVVETAITVDLDVKPASDENPINIGVPGTVPVAVLSDPEFDAPASVDATTLTFGQTGDEESLAHLGNGDPRCAAEDVNGDSRRDLVCHFHTADTGFGSGDTEGVLRGELTDGTGLEGTDVVWILE